MKQTHATLFSKSWHWVSSRCWEWHLRIWQDVCVSVFSNATDSTQRNVLDQPVTFVPCVSCPSILPFHLLSFLPSFHPFSLLSSSLPRMKDYIYHSKIVSVWLSNFHLPPAKGRNLQYESLSGCIVHSSCYFVSLRGNTL